MSEEKKKSLRTQGKYTDKGSRKEKRQKESPVLNELPGKRTTHFTKRNSSERKGDASVNDDVENQAVATYEENSPYSFEELQERKKPFEMKQGGLYILSETENGQSKVFYEPYFLPHDDADDLLSLLLDSTTWNEKNLVIRGIEYPQPRLVAWYGPFPYSYSGVILEPAKMPDSILNIKRKIEDFLPPYGMNASLNSVLLNCYRDGKDSVAWHSDDELSMGVCPTIASLSLGDTRKFEMKRKISCDKKNESNEYFVNLTHGSLLIMDGCMQKDWQHRVPKEYHDRQLRINLTFRTVYALDDFRSSSEVTASDTRLSRNNIKSGLFDKRTSNTEKMFAEDDFPELNPARSEATDDICHDKSDNSNSSFGTEDGLDQSQYFDEDSSPQNLSACKNNLNYEGQNVKQDIPKKNIPDVDNSVSADEVADKNDNYSNYGTDDHPDNSINVEENSDMDSSVNSSRNNSINKASTSSQWLNVNAVEFVPHNVKSEPLHTATTLSCDAAKFIPHNVESKPLHAARTSSYENDKFDSLSLQELFQYPFMDINGDVLQSYAYALKRVIDVQLSVKFRENDYNEFKFLSELTDGSQSDKNQKLISERMCYLVKLYSRSPSRSYSKSHNDYRRRSYENEGGVTREYKYSNSEYNKRFSNENRRRSSENQRENRKSNRGLHY